MAKNTLQQRNARKTTEEFIDRGNAIGSTSAMGMKPHPRTRCALIDETKNCSM
jgi:hypothetical protein